MVGLQTGQHQKKVIPGLSIKNNNHQGLPTLKAAIKPF
jgi:hypothetical protein